MEQKNFDIIIIGGGPAGCSAAIYCASRGCNVAVLEKDDIGGTVGKVSSVTHYLSVDKDESGVSFKNKLKDQLKKYKIPVINEEVINLNIKDEKKIISTKDNQYQSKVVVFATGLKAKKLEIPGANNFLDNGIYGNARKNAEKFKDKDIFVVGGADGAIKEAIYLAHFAKKLTIIHFEDNINPIKEFKEKIEKLNNVEVLLNSKISKIIGEKEIETLELTNIKTNEKVLINAKNSGIFPYIGGTPDISEELGLELVNGFIKVNLNMETNIPGVFAAGDICVKDIRQVSTAVADGTIAGIRSSQYLKK